MRLGMCREWEGFGADGGEVTHGVDNVRQAVLGGAAGEGEPFTARELRDFKSGVAI